MNRCGYGHCLSIALDTYKITQDQTGNDLRGKARNYVWPSIEKSAHGLFTFKQDFIKCTNLSEESYAEFQVKVQTVQEHDFCKQIRILILPPLFKLFCIHAKSLAIDWRAEAILRTIDGGIRVCMLHQADQQTRNNLYSRNNRQKSYVAIIINENSYEATEIYVGKRA